MSATQIILQIFSSLVFLAWALMMFRVLFGIRSRSAARTGKLFPGVAETIKGWQDWWHSDTLQRQRRVLIGLTLLMLFCNVLMYAVLAR